MKNMRLRLLIQSPKMSLLVFAICLSLSASFAFGQDRSATRSAIKVESSSAVPEAIVSPIVYVGQNTTCADLNASALPALAHISEDWGIKFAKSADGGLPNGTFTFTDDQTAFYPRTLLDGAPAYPTRTITFTTANNPARMLSFSSQVQITAVLIKAGPDSYAYPYSPFIFSDTNLDTGDNRGISHILFCYGLPGGTTAGDGSVSGRVVNSFGVGISNARMSLVDASTGEALTAITNAFGYYTIDNIAVGEFYVLNIAHKRYKFAESSKAFSVNDSVANVDFVATP